jgi:hypothetical protein
MNIAQPTLAPAAPADAIPRDYNFAAAILEHNLDAGRGEKIAYIDPRGSWTYRDLAARVDSFGRALRSLDIRPEERLPRRDQGRRGADSGQHAADRG